MLILKRPLTGTQASVSRGEYNDVLPYDQAAANKAAACFSVRECTC